MSDRTFDLASARQAAADDRTAEWVGQFLATEGGNAILAAALAQDPHWWAGPVWLPLDRLERLAGPEDEEVLCVIDPEEWEDDVAAMNEELAAGWEPPPLLAQHEPDGRLLLQDGNHRFEALSRDGADGAWVLIYFDSPDARDAFVESAVPCSPPQSDSGGNDMGADGTWNITMDSPMGAQQATLTLVTDGGSLSGKLAGPQGEMAFDGGTVDGDNLAWTIAIEQPMPMQIETTATVDGDNLTGEAKLGSFGTAKLTGTRA